MKELKYDVKLGVHLYRGDRNLLNTIEELKINTAQIFSRNPRSFKSSRSEIPNFPFSPIFIHSPYVVNLSSPDENIFNLSYKLIIEELNLAHERNFEGVVVHTGSSKGEGKDKAKYNFLKALEKIFKEYKGEKKLIIENSAGYSEGWGSTPEDLYSIYKEFPVYFCLDTCHLFSAGYDLRDPKSCENTLSLFFEKIPYERFSLIHLNDSFYPLGSKKDKHEHIGKGEIGRRGFYFLLQEEKVRKLPLILETPKDSPEADFKNLNTIREML
ncbi:MAG: deoxyribonuclease IV [Dictyoglomus sp.]|nr:deoxyribonuclease IV [Dictyoglomus sp.]MCX7941878.1 deoxyribonuclease IV [Dictyoglomaceae bacterium]MDW8188266.1 deoxyribonuclease IV [Dictyoglomus sp.]